MPTEEGSINSNTDRQTSRIKPRWMALSVIGILCLGVCIWWFADSKPESTSSSIEDSFILENASFYLFDQGVPQEKVQLNQGKYSPPGNADNGAHVRVDSKVQFADLDGDQDIDASAILEWVDNSGDKYSSWRALYFWLWDDNKVVPVKWPGAWQWNCVTKDQPKGGALSITSPASPFGVVIERNTNNLCGDDILDKKARTDASYFIGVKKGYPVVTAGQDLALATESCTGGDSDDPASSLKYTNITDTLKSDPRVQPFKNAPVVDGPRPPKKSPSKPTAQAPKIEYMIDKEFEPSDRYLRVHDGFVPVVIVWGYDYQGCGWASWDNVKKLL
ncbi:hypothetical protein [Stackebrandtia nassauensis]|uniref:Uncharacterized protein n=1 Tax=Stackebrandtia nassauensis (strain DSM 44728 / CIP 108903 / NRRL B-16338 / NBRC 102104 / LLR-40K-21) TaxID=446470 RepID=D3Q610_STANL|nr:hypothetical protein [Stackebrandtia nassauensis]ADD40309.1 hypothetical protein Snas_0595 [Stackebrandtia nassauensis DSM 44728]